MASIAGCEPRRALTAEYKPLLSSIPKYAINAHLSSPYHEKIFYSSFSYVRFGFFLFAHNLV